MRAVTLTNSKWFHTDGSSTRAPGASLDAGGRPAEEIDDEIDDEGLDDLEPDDDELADFDPDADDLEDYDPDADDLSGDFDLDEDLDDYEEDLTERELRFEKGRRRYDDLYDFGYGDDD